MATAALGLCLGVAPIMVFAFGVFFKTLSQEYHAGQGAISFAFTLQNLAAALFAPLTGRLIDRLGDPKDKGLLPDGIVEPDKGSTAKENTSVRD